MKAYFSPSVSLIALLVSLLTTACPANFSGTPEKDASTNTILDLKISFDTTVPVTPIDLGTSDMTSSVIGQPCDAGGCGGSLCVRGTCRSACDEPTGPCNNISNCPADQACVPTTQPNTFVCVPPADLPQQCSGSTAGFCPVNQLCSGADQNNLSCVPNCPEGASIGDDCNGGKCLGTGSCLVCIP